MTSGSAQRKPLPGGVHLLLSYYLAHRLLSHRWISTSIYPLLSLIIHSVNFAKKKRPCFHGLFLKLSSYFFGRSFWIKPRPMIVVNVSSFSKSIDTIVPQIVTPSGNTIPAAVRTFFTMRSRRSLSNCFV